jgi:hypothetical protein
MSGTHNSVVSGAFKFVSEVLVQGKSAGVCLINLRLVLSVMES